MEWSLYIKLFLSETPIAFKIGEGLIVPDEQADPFEIAIPSLSRWINNRSLEIFGIVRFINPEIKQFWHLTTKCNLSVVSVGLLADS